MMDRFRMLPNYRYYSNADGVLTTRYEKPLRDYRIYGNSIQDGTPSPDNPIEIQSVGEKTKNLFDIDNMEYIHYGSANLYPKVENGLFISPGRTGVSFYWMPVIKIKPLTTYTVSFEEISGVTNRGVYLYDDMNKTNAIFVVKNEFIGSKRIFTVTTSDTSNYLAIAVGGDDIYTAIISNIQIEEGSIATEYEPYGKYKIPIEVSNENGGTQTYNIFLDEPLRKVGDYADYIDFRSGKVVRLMGSRVFDGTEVWVTHTSTTEGYVFRNENLLTPLIGAPIQATCMSHFELTQRYETAMFKKGQYRFSYNTQNHTILNSRIYVSAEQTTVQDFKIWLSENKPVLLYPLATPTEEVIDLPKIQLNKGTNNIIIKTTTQPSQVNWQYYK